MSHIEEANARVLMELIEILLVCQNCDYQISELLKVANCVLKREEFFKLMAQYDVFKKNVCILEALIDEVEVPLKMVQILAMKTMVRELKREFDGLIVMLDMANNRIDQDDIDFEKAEVIHCLLDQVEFDVIDFDDFETNSEAQHLVLKVVDESEHDVRYTSFKMLRITGFEKRVDAYAYALQHGISKDMVVSR